MLKGRGKIDRGSYVGTGRAKRQPGRVPAGRKRNGP